MTIEQVLTQIADSPFATGIDLSKWQDHFDIDLATFARVLDILDFVVLRSSTGSEEDVRFEAFYKELEEHPGIVRGVYHFFSSRVDWEVQLDLLLSLIAGKDIDFLVLDFEPYGNEKSAGFALTFIRFLKALQREYPTKRVLIYSNKYTYQDWLRAYTAECDNWPYWHAQYPWAVWDSITTYFLSWWNELWSSLTKKPSLPSSRSGSWDMWQVGDKTRVAKHLGVGGTDLDLSISRLARQAFIDWVGTPARWTTGPGGDGEEEVPCGCCGVVGQAAVVAYQLYELLKGAKHE